MLEMLIVAPHRVSTVGLIGLCAVSPLPCGNSIHSDPAGASYTLDMATVYQIHGRVSDQRRLDVCGAPRFSSNACKALVLMQRTGLILLMSG